MREWIDKLKWLWSGYSFGNAIADSMTIPRRVFHRAIELGGLPDAEVVLAEIHRRGVSVLEARRLVAPIIIVGLFAAISKSGAHEDLLMAHSKITHQFPKAGSRDAYADAFKNVDALVQA